MFPPTKNDSSFCTRCFPSLMWNFHPNWHLWDSRKQWKSQQRLNMCTKNIYEGQSHKNRSSTHLAPFAHIPSCSFVPMPVKWMSQVLLLINWAAITTIPWRNGELKSTLYQFSYTFFCTPIFHWYLQREGGLFHTLYIQMWLTERIWDSLTIDT